MQVCVLRLCIVAAGKSGWRQTSGWGTVAMARPLDEIVRLYRRWFCADPNDGTAADRPIRASSTVPRVWTWRSATSGAATSSIYQPVIFQGALPTDERSAAALFALAATSRDPIPVIARMHMLVLRRGLRPRREISDQADPRSRRPAQHHRRRASIASGCQRRFPSVRATGKEHLT